MKVLNKPTATAEAVQIPMYSLRETIKSGILNCIPFVNYTPVPREIVTAAGRIRFSNIILDPENDEVILGVKIPELVVGYVKLHGILPIMEQPDGTFVCTIDHVEHLE